MIPKITTSTIYSVLGNNSSRVPLAIKDVANSCGLTAASYMSGDRAEGQDRFIDEFGTQAIWLWGIPVYKKALDFLMFKPAKIDPKIDVRIFKNPEFIQAAKDFAPSKEVLKSIENAVEHSKLAKGLNAGKFAVSTLLTAGTYLGLTKFRHNYTENKIKKEILSSMPAKSASQETKSKEVAFTGGVQDFVFDPVKNLMLVDGIITGERLSHSKNPQDFLGYVIKEGSFWGFMYAAGPLIAKAFEKHADKLGKSIDLDARVIFGDKLKNSFADKSVLKHLNEFNSVDLSDGALYRFALNPENENLVIQLAKESDVISLMKGSKKVDTRKYVELKDLRGVAQKLEKLYNQYEKSGQSLDEFFKGVQKLKKGAVLKNIGACIGALGVLAPGIMLLCRKFGTGKDYQVRQDIEKKIIAAQ